MVDKFPQRFRVRASLRFGQEMSCLIRSFGILEFRIFVSALAMDELRPGRGLLPAPALAPELGASRRRQRRPHSRCSAGCAGCGQPLVQLRTGIRF